MVETPSVGNGVQSCETTRNSLGLNYESPALTAELQAQFTRERGNLALAQEQLFDTGI
jgi:hypothetical protein